MSNSPETNNNSSALKRQGRTNSKRIPARPTLHIIPESSEDDVSRKTHAKNPSESSNFTLHSLAEPSFYNHAVSQFFKSSNSGSSPISEAKTRHRSVAISGADIKVLGESDVVPLTVEDSSLLMPRPAPQPSVTSRSPSPSLTVPSQSPPRSPVTLASPSPDGLRLNFDDMGLSLNFPHPPLPSTERGGAKSPAPSLSSSTSSTPSGSNPSTPVLHTSGLPVTPTSDDGFQQPLPRLTPRRASIKPLVIVKSSPDQPQHLANKQITVHTEIVTVEKEARDNDESEWMDASDTEDAGAWYAHEFSDMFSLSTPLPSAIPARPESAFYSTPLSPKRGRLSKALPEIPLPSAQLDPTFPKWRSSKPIPLQPPPPVPVRSQTRRKTRPPPRMSVPADVDFSDIEINVSDEEVIEEEAKSSGSAYSQDNDWGSVMTFDLETPMRLPVSFPTSPYDDADTSTIGGTHDMASPASAAPTAWKYQSRESISMIYPNERVLKSRWSTSTLGSVRSVEENRALAKMKRLVGAGGLKKPRTKPPSPPKPIIRRPGEFLPDIDYAERTVKKRSSRSSSIAASDTGSVDSGDSTGSGLKRKPIPVEMFLRQ